MKLLKLQLEGINERGVFVSAKALRDGETWQHSGSLILPREWAAPDGPLDGIEPGGWVEVEVKPG